MSNTQQEVAEPEISKALFTGQRESLSLNQFTVQFLLLLLRDKPFIKGGHPHPVNFNGAIPAKDCLEESLLEVVTSSLLLWWGCPRKQLFQNF